MSTSTTTTVPRSWRAGMRQRALDLHEQSWMGTAVAAALGVTGGAASQWLKRAGEGGGAEALRDRPLPGPTPKLTTEQREQIPALLTKGAEAYGFIGEVWTMRRVATVIDRESGVHDHPAHVSRLLRALGWSVQKPSRGATQRDEAAIATWRDERRMVLEKKAAAEERTVVWVDEAGFYLLPFVARTYAPRGQTPVLHAPLTRDHLAVISGVTADGRLFTHIQDVPFRRETIVGFLRQPRRAGGPG